ncbi:MAG: GNAT family N-acetyltransferase [Chloroflexi bacterium]|nr:GNAT family N-acetyltransferase [Chloroflexota bacterium]MBU1748423.1 GNAT family N-acetyltransferase [Chloroflexota bacterium]MBU1878097.1 GNAT family N-acetyltransferase [Chloroflexota bacterium]
MNDPITIRHFNWDDAPALVDLANAAADAGADAGGSAQTMSLPEFRRDFGGPQNQPERDTLLAQVNGRIVAWVMSVAEGRERTPALPVPLLLYVHPDYAASSVGARLMNKALTHARELGVGLVASPVWPQQQARRAFLQANGFAYGRSWWQLRASLDRPLNLAPLPAGFYARTYRGRQDNAPLAALVNDIFGTAYLDRTYTPGDVQHWISDSEFDPALLQLLTAADGTLAGYVWSWADPGENEERAGFIGDLGLREAYQGRGLGRWLLRRAMTDLRQRGLDWADLDVDGTNATALRLYESEGFAVRQEVQWYEKRLQGNANVR